MKTTLKTQLKVKNLEAKDLLLSIKEEVYEVNEALGKTILCCENERAFHLKPLDYSGKEEIIIAKINSDETLTITGFKKHLAYTGLN